MKAIDILSAVLLLIGGLNLGLWGLSQIDLIGWICGGNDVALSRLIYILIGAAAVYQIISVKKIWTRWRGESADT